MKKFLHSMIGEIPRTSNLKELSFIFTSSIRSRGRSFEATITSKWLAMLKEIAPPLARAARAGRSIAPEVLEAGRRQLGIAHRVLNVLVAEIGLQRAGIDAVIGELVTAGMPEHVRMHWKVEASRHTEPGDHLAETRRREW